MLHIRKYLFSYLAFAFLGMVILFVVTSGSVVSIINAQKGVRVTPTPPSCTKPPKLSANLGLKKGTPVRVVINSSQFNSTQYNCLKTAFDNWNTANSTNGSGVVFTVTHSNVPVASNNPPGVVGAGVAAQINSGTPSNAHAGGNTDVLGDSSGVGGYYTIINPGTTNCTALTQTMAHEIGHMMGLKDCEDCDSGTSVMNGVPCDQQGNCDLNDTTEGATTPSSCDNDSVRDFMNPPPTPTPTPPPSPTATPPGTGGDDTGGCPCGNCDSGCDDGGGGEPTCSWEQVPGQCYGGTAYGNCWDTYGAFNGNNEGCQSSDPYCDPPQNVLVCR